MCYMGESKLYRMRRVRWETTLAGPQNPQTTRRRMRAHGLVHHTYRTLFLFFFLCDDEASQTRWKVNTRCEVSPCTGRGWGVLSRYQAQELIKQPFAFFKSKQRRHLLAIVPFLFRIFCFHPVQEPSFKLLLVLSDSLFIPASFCVLANFKSRKNLAEFQFFAKWSIQASQLSLCL